MKDYLDEYLKFITEDKQLSINTQISYKSDVEQYISYVTAKGFKNVKDVTNSTLVYYIMYLRKCSKAASTISRNLASIRSYYSFLEANDYVQKNPTQGLESPRLKKRMPKILTREEVDLLLSQPNTEDIKGIRDKAMLELLYSTGIKITELTALDLEDLSDDFKTLRIKKPQSEKLIDIEEVKEYMDEYVLHGRPKMVFNKKEDSLFVNVNGGRLTRQGFWKIVKKYQIDSRIDKEITPITLRHSFAAHLMVN